MSEKKGIIYAFLASLLIPAVFVSIKYLLQYTDPISLAVQWFTSAFVLSFLVSLAIHKKKLFIAFKKHWKPGLLIGLVNSVGAMLFFNANNLLEPQVAGFIAKADVLFMILVGVLLLKEKLTKIEIVGMLIALGGVIMLTFSQGDYTILGSVLMILTTIAVSIQVYLVKRFISVAPSIMIVFRAFFSLIILTLYLLITQDFHPVPASVIPIIVLGTLLTPVIGWMFFFSALHYIKASKAAIMRCLDPFFVVIYALIIFNTLPTARQWLGGIIVVIGAAVTVFAKKDS